MKRIVFIFLALNFLTSCVSYKRSNTIFQYGNYMKNINNEYSQTSGLNYIITFPEDYSDNSDKYPVIVFLHSLAERGDDINLLVNNPDGQGYGIAEYAKETDFPFITISPLCPKDTYWPLITRKLDKLLSDVSARYRVDKKRIYLTGVSMGGMGVWSFANNYPKWFAAIAPISGGIYFPPMIIDKYKFKDIPIWAFHSRYDQEIPLKKEEVFAQKIKELNNSIIYTIEESDVHYLQNDIYRKGELFNWFLTKIKS